MDRRDVPSRDIRDGLSYTIMVVEAADAGINWMEPRDIDAEKVRFHVSFGREVERHATNSEISSHHSGGANVALLRTGRCDFFPNDGSEFSKR